MSPEKRRPVTSGAASQRSTATTTVSVTHQSRLIAYALERGALCTYCGSAVDPADVIRGYFSHPDCINANQHRHLLPGGLMPYCACPPCSRARTR